MTTSMPAIDGPAPVLVGASRSFERFLWDSGWLESTGARIYRRVTADDIRGRMVVGMLPLYLAAEAESVVDVRIDVPMAMRGKVIPPEDFIRYAHSPACYRVRQADADRGPEVVCSRFQGVEDYVKSEGLAERHVPRIRFAMEGDVSGRHVIGSIPIRLAALAYRVTEVRLDASGAMGNPLTGDQVRALASGVGTYEVTKAEGVNHGIGI